MWSSKSKQERNYNVLCILLALVSPCLSAQAALFDGCDYTYQIKAGYSYLESPYYPNSYPAGTSCRYKFEAPMDYEITINCTINLDKGANACSSEYFYLARDGDSLLRDSEQFCGSGNFIRKSVFRSAVLAYVSYGSYGNFRCQLYASPQPCDCGWSVNTKIVNGQEASTNEYPSMVALKDKTSNLQSFCAGAIVSHRHIITACHCTRTQPNPANIQAWVGDHNLQSATETKYAAIYQISQIIEHPSYTDYPNVNNDIAILVTSTPIEWSRGVAPICLPANNNNDFSYNYVDVIGWGTTSFAGATSAVLRKITVMVPDQQTCANTYQDQAQIFATQICTYDYTGNSKDSCQYDSGGPVILKSSRQFLLGCISFGKVCGQGGYATGVNTRISSYLQWIYDNTGYSTCKVSM